MSMLLDPGPLVEMAQHAVVRQNLVCGWGGCANPPDCGTFCRSCWHGKYQRDLGLALTSHTLGSAVGELVSVTAQRDRLARLSGHDRGWCRGCGHMSMVHTDGGCGGLSISGHDEWGNTHTACGCRGFRGDTPTFPQSTDPAQHGTAGVGEADHESA